MLLFLCLALVVGAVDAFFGENYMFLFAPPAGTPLVWVFDTFGRQIYLLITFLLLAGVQLFGPSALCGHASSRGGARPAVCVEINIKKSGAIFLRRSSFAPWIKIKWNKSVKIANQEKRG